MALFWSLVLFIGVLGESDIPLIATVKSPKVNRKTVISLRTDMAANQRVRDVKP